MINRLLLLLALVIPMSAIAYAGPVLDAIKSGDAGAVKAALAGGGDVNERTALQTTLIAAIRGKNLEIVELLLTAGADVNQGAGSATPLLAACGEGRADIVKFLLDKGADAKLARNSLTPLHRAAEKGCLECAKLLIAAGADNNALTSEGTPALHLARSGGHQDVADYLVSVGYTPPKVPLDAAKLAAGDAEAGRKLFKENCVGCHQIIGTDENHRGPPLYGVIGRAKGSIQSQENSETLRRAGGTWTYEDLNAFLAAPSAAYPGTVMPIGTELDENIRADIIAFLRSQHDNPPPLPQ